VSAHHLRARTCEPDHQITISKHRHELTAHQVRQVAASRAARTAIEQGFPPRVTDTTVLRNVARLLKLEPKRIR
jgi:hypothetical protein